VCVTAPTGAAAYNVAGYILHSLLMLPVRTEFKELEGKLLQTLQESMAGIVILTRCQWLAGSVLVKWTGDFAKYSIIEPSTVLCDHYS
jgi:hypothetical protein